jgi:uncharacterized protein (TIGR02118 family)
MVKAFFVLYRRPDLNVEEFRSYWKEVHGPIVAKIPELRKYVQSHVLPGPDGQTSVVDGLVELQFDSPGAMESGLSSPEGQAAVADVTRFADASRIGMVVVEDYQIL